MRKVPLLFIAKLNKSCNGGEQTMAFKIKLEPIGVEIGCEEGETVMEAALRQGVKLMHGCREGRCSACKSVLLGGDYEMEYYSTFALPDFERESGYMLLCKAIPYSDLTIELIHYETD